MSTIENEQIAPWAAFWRGVWLWQHAAPWEPRGERGGSGRHLGATQKRGRQISGSPNFIHEARVQTFVDPVGAAGLDVDPETAMLLRLAQLDAELVSLSDEQGPLTWAMNQNHRAVVNGGPHASSGSNVTHDAPEGEWSRAVGQLVLCRKPTTGEGFVATVASVDSGGSNRMGLTELVAGTWQSLDSTWELRYVQIVYVDAEFVSFTVSTPSTLSAKAYRGEVEYLFSVASAAQYAAAHALADRGNAI